MESAIGRLAELKLTSLGEAAQVVLAVGGGDLALAGGTADRRLAVVVCASVRLASSAYQKQLRAGKQVEGKATSHGHSPKSVHTMVPTA